MPIQTAIDSISNSQGSPFGFKNRIINGAMVIDQRNAAASLNPADQAYSLDRWKCRRSQASKYTVQQNAGSVTPPVGFTNYLGVTSSSAYSVVTGDYFAVQQIIEGFNTADLAWGTVNAQTVTLSFWVRSSLTGTFGGALNNRAEIRAYGFTYTINSANTWEYKTITIAGDTTGTWLTNNDIGLYVNFNLGSGSTYGSASNGSWTAGSTQFTPSGTVSVVGTNTATWYITGVQLEKGTQATAFDYRDYGNELRLCQRYYYLAASGVNGQIGTGYYYSTTQAQIQVKFAVSMRAAPVISTVTGTGYYKIEPVGGGVDGFNSFTIYLPNTESAMIYNNTEVSGTANYQGQTYTNNAAAFVAFSSEL